MSSVSAPLPGHGALAAGLQLNGVYEIDALIAVGGMGEVYRGHEIQTGVPVAIKLIRFDMANDEAILALFRKEASALSRVYHEVIVRYFVFSLDPSLRRHYLAMELVEGESLSDLLERGPLDVNSVQLLKMRLASGLQAAHDREVIHRDVSPDNVIVPGGEVARARIIDFGIARSTRLGDTTVIGGGFAGKYNYVSPEQLGLFGGEITAKSDIYSLGLVLAQCLLGTPLDMGGSQANIVAKRRAVPDLAGIDPGLRSLIAKMLQPDPADRPASMAEVMRWSPTEGTLIAPRGANEVLAPFRMEPAMPQKERASEAALLMSAPIVKHAKNARLRNLGLVGALGVLLLGVIGVGTKMAMNGKNENAGLAPPPNQKESPKHNDTKPEDDVRLRDKFLREFDGGACFLALPAFSESNLAEIDGYAPSRTPFEAFEAAFKKANGFEPKIELHQVSESQCSVLTFLRRLQSASARLADLEISSGDLQSGDILRGRLETSAPHALLLIVDDEGIAHNATSLLKPTPNGQEFALPLRRAPAQQPQPALLLAIAATRPIEGFGTARSRVAKDFFPDLATELLQSGSPPAFALKFFRIN